MKKYINALGIIGLLSVVYGVLSAILASNVIWFSYFAIGGTLFLAWINNMLKNDSLFEKSKIYVLKTYGIYLLFAILIEIVGELMLNLWNYPSFDLKSKVIHVFLIGYPFVFFFIHESFKIILKKVPSLSLAIILTTLINAFVNEIPNTFAWEWVYTIPYITFEILEINIIVIIGWIVLVTVPIITKRIINKQMLIKSIYKR